MLVVSNPEVDPRGARVAVQRHGRRVIALFGGLLELLLQPPKRLAARREGALDRDAVAVLRGGQCHSITTCHIAYKTVIIRNSKEFAYKVLNNKETLYIFRI